MSSAAHPVQLSDERYVFVVIIGVDPHKATHTASALDQGTHQQLGAVEIPASLAVVSVGLPWASPRFPARAWGTVELTSSGTSHPVRVIVLVAALLLWWAVRAGSRRGALAACLVAATALPLGLSAGLSAGLTSGRISYALAIVLAVTAIWRSPVAAPPQP